MQALMNVADVQQSAHGTEVVLERRLARREAGPVAVHS